ALSKARESGRRTACVSNLRQLSVAVSIYAGENQGDFPTINPSNHWPAQLFRGYENLDVLLCPSDRTPAARDIGVKPDDAPRSYVMNLFRDHFSSTLSPADLQRFNSGNYAATMNEGSVGQPADTIVFGEKRTGVKDFYFDLAGVLGGEHRVLHQRRHMRTASPGSGGSNYAFVDGGVRFLPNGSSFHPVNLWGVTGYTRTNEDAQPEAR
ncbi:MAG: prepilin-type cleavage/methylation domain-containing protein, partial [Gammaproteobacteria bacterium]